MEQANGYNLLELIRCVIHTILYIHQIYPLDTFERCERYGIAVYFCTSSVVGDYLNPILNDINNYLAMGVLQSVRISVWNPTQVRYQMQLPQTTEKLCTLEGILKWQELFRNTLYRLIYVGQSSSLQVASTFQIFLQVVDNMQQQPLLRWKTTDGDPLGYSKKWESLYSCELFEQPFHLFREEMD
ncbi:hypothetical protein GpartN1_g2269.t1 [Galdieria partita]|uniref:HORMA domain-containing protein n=1 Tax=Galdieria partita TaxID=83374 RepID=A0A9C7UP43_9RHOD|nr:hypothetical protein GpartN1_g2269.t1 [Galdieria partita]